MNTNTSISEFFYTLREQKWALYVPEQIYRAHCDGLLRGWGITSSLMRYYPYTQLEGRVKPILELLQSQGADLKIPFVKSREPDWEENNILKKFENHLVLYTGIEDCPLIPEQTIFSDSLWESLMSTFDLETV